MDEKGSVSSCTRFAREERILQPRTDEEEMNDLGRGGRGRKLGGRAYLTSFMVNGYVVSLDQ